MKSEIKNHSDTDQSKGLQLRTKQSALRITKLVRALPKDTVSNAIGQQLIRSGTSVAANTRAAFRGRSKKEFIAKIGIVIEEADESQLWIGLLVESGIFPEAKVKELLTEASELVSIFVSVSKQAKQTKSEI